ncbi:hypothetical protein ABT065_07315 [Streptomyces sp. NPDC002764]|uniref:hypothetical protein n=1 Tax=Streptomyces sp. NPDC002764 TaxID=3154428 RepID=UPI003324A3AF
MRGPRSPQPAPPPSAPQSEGAGPAVQPPHVGHGVGVAPAPVPVPATVSAVPVHAAATTAVQPAAAVAQPTAAPATAAAPPPATTPASTRTGGQPAVQPRTRRLSAAPAAEHAWSEPRRPRAARGRSRNEVGWVKAHGGAGVTSLVEVLGGVDVGARWPDPSRGEPRRVVLVGRTSARGLRSVSQALGSLQDGRAPQGLELLAVVLVADAPGRLPLGLLRRVRVLRSAARVQRVPWIPAWRTGGSPKVLPRQFDRLAELVGSELYAEGAAS